MPHPIINIADVELQPYAGAPGMGATRPGPKFGSRRGLISTSDRRAQKLGYNITRAAAEASRPFRSTTTASTRRCSSSSRAKARYGSAMRAIP